MRLFPMYKRWLEDEIKNPDSSPKRKQKLRNLLLHVEWQEQGFGSFDWPVPNFTVSMNLIAVQTQSSEKHQQEGRKRWR